MAVIKWLFITFPRSGGPFWCRSDLHDFHFERGDTQKQVGAWISHGYRVGWDPTKFRHALPVWSMIL